MPEGTATFAEPTSFTPASLRTAGIAAMGRALPERVVSNAEIAERLEGVDDEWIYSRTGIRERRFVSEDEGLTSLATAAARAALDRAEVEATGVDLVLVGTQSPDDFLPASSPLVAERLGTANAGAIDLGAACTGFMSGLALAAGQIEAGRAECAVVVGAEVLSRHLDLDDRGTAILFADGAAAAVVTADGPGRIGPTVLGSDGSCGSFISGTQDERVVRMRGRDTFKAAVPRMAQATEQVLAMAGLSLDDVDAFVYHQANARITAAVGQRLGLDTDRVVDCIDRYGNTSAASLPIALCEAEQDGLLTPGATVLVAAFGAGLAWGAGVLEWGAAA